MDLVHIEKLKFRRNWDFLKAANENERCFACWWFKYSDDEIVGLKQKPPTGINSLPLLHGEVNGFARRGRTYATFHPFAVNRVNVRLVTGLQQNILPNRMSGFHCPHPCAIASPEIGARFLINR